ncbi:MAG: site-2 protease family protein [Candidatus Desulfofervidaceae bacterium]|nr:site-2 protease family protein [Candidatus Desulfofervidaceae bacterium]
MRLLLHFLLFFVTFLTTTGAGALQAGFNPFSSLGAFLKGLPFSLTMMFILLSHELGHYFASRHHRVAVTLPYFIPAPSLIGTFGAFIKIKASMPNRRVLFDIGIAGPLAGIIVSLPILAYGLIHSRIIITSLPPKGLVLGENLLLKFLTATIWGKLPETAQIVLHPTAFAGWIGLFVTALNLIPVGQLDGGHIAYALLGEKYHGWLSRIMIISLVGLGFLGWQGWLIWAVLLLFLGIGHPPPMDSFISLDRKRNILGVIALLIFILTFTPVPFSMH